MKCQLYRYGRRLGHWAIWDEKGVKVGSFLTQEEAAAETYRLNGWKKRRSERQR